MNLDSILISGVALTTIVGALSLFVSIVIQLTKDLIPKVVPTKLYALIVSVVSTMVSVLCFMFYKEIDIELYMIFGSFALGFIVAYIATNGWDSFNELKNRFMK